MKEQILQLHAQGLNYTEIANKLQISKGTISYHLNPRVKEKTFRRRTQNRKDNLIKLKTEAGGKCQCCGYDRCFNALEFHHKDPKTKNRTYKGVSAILGDCSYQKAKEETLKCVLICANCHREIHDGIRKL